MAGWAREHKVIIWAAVIGALGAVIAAIITVTASSGGINVDQKNGGGGTVCIGSTCN